MTLIKWNNRANGLDRRSQLLPGFENFFNDFFSNDFLSKDFAGFVPAVNIAEKENSYNLQVSAPGFNKHDFKVELENGVLTISGENKSEKTEEDKNFRRREFNYGSFKRSFNVSDLIDEEKIEARYENGILNIDLHKKEVAKATSAKQIKIS